MSAGSAAVARPWKACATCGGAPHLGREGGAAPVPVGRRHAHGRGVGAQHGVGRQHREQAIEVAVAGRGQKGADQLAVLRDVGGGRGGAADAAAGAAGELAGGRRRALDDRRDLFEREVEHVVQHEGDALLRRQHVEDDQQRGADRVGEARPRDSGLAPAGHGVDRPGPSGCSPRARRERSMSRQTRATTVVSQPPRFSTPDVSARLTFSQASCTASSASPAAPSMRSATARRCGRLSSNRWANQSLYSSWSSIACSLYQTTSMTDRRAGM